MYWTYLRRELAGRKKQTIIVAVGLAVAIALVIVVNSLSAGVRDAQAQALESVYGVGTDLTVTGAAAEPGEGGGQRFEFDSEAGETTDGTTSVSQSRLTADFMRGTLDASTIESVASLHGVAAASGALSLTNITFSGEMPDRSQMQQGGQGEAGGEPPSGGPDGAGGSAFDLNSFTVLGIDPEDTAVGPLSAVEVSEGRALDASDAGALVAVVDATYATTNEIAVGDTINVGGSDVEVVGIITSTSSDADTAANVYIPLDVAQSLAGLEDVVSTVYVQATSADQIEAVQAEIEGSVADVTVSSQSDLASTVSSSLSSASSLITNLGTWLSILVLAVALALAVLFTISGVTRRTREFGTLKAIGWSNGRVVGQVAGESVIQGLIGGAIGLAVGLAGIGIINLISPTISSTSSTTGQGGSGQGGGPMGGGFGGMAQQTATDVVLHAPVTLWVVAAAVGIAIAGGLIAGAFGGWRAARLSPAEALRSVG
ncbi:ABC transporter permease [Microbacterium sp.]|uniref:ABC transporter permease n=1 Tax=unclassified Microbacterium TaxID=2609290 RepID=UPI00261EF284|nr:ABC transporter permease [Microbacterium sp.]